MAHELEKYPGEVLKADLAAPESNNQFRWCENAYRLSLEKSTLADANMISIGLIQPPRRILILSVKTILVPDRPIINSEKYFPPMTKPPYVD